MIKIVRLASRSTFTLSDILIIGTLKISLIKDKVKRSAHLVEFDDAEHKDRKLEREGNRNDDSDGESGAPRAREEARCSGPQDDAAPHDAQVALYPQRDQLRDVVHAVRAEPRAEHP